MQSLGIASGVSTAPLPLHCLEPYRHLGYAPGAFPEAERAAQETLVIPLYPEMTDEPIKTVAAAIEEAVALAGSRR